MNINAVSDHVRMRQGQKVRRNKNLASRPGNLKKIDVSVTCPRQAFKAIGQTLGTSLDTKQRTEFSATTMIMYCAKW